MSNNELDTSRVNAIKNLIGLKEKQVELTIKKYSPNKTDKSSNQMTN